MTGPAPRFRRRMQRARTIGAAALLAATTALAPAASAAAATPAGPAEGWLRVAHLSPDTTPLRVSLVALSGVAVGVRLPPLAYGTVSQYVALPDDTYVVRMTPSGAPSTSAPVAEATVRIDGDRASTVAVFGRNEALRPTVLGDDLRPPTPGHARVRLVQASARSGPVDVLADDGTRLASGVGAGVVTGYADLPTGSHRLSATRGRATSRSSLDLRRGEIVSLFVLDDASGGLVLREVVDMADVGTAPRGFVATGGGYLAQRDGRTGPGIALGVLLATLLLAGWALRARRSAGAR